MRLLLDTHVLLWMIGESQRLPSGWRSLIETADEVLLSAVVAWEIEIERVAGRLDAPSPDTLLEVLAPLGFTPLPISWSHAAASASLPRHHGDPFDRLLVAQAVEEDAVLASVDRAMQAYDVPCLAVEHESDDRMGQDR